jgi:hypothetical protein
VPPNPNISPSSSLRLQSKAHSHIDSKLIQY